MSNTTRYPQCHMRTSLGNCDPIGGFCTSVNESICEALHEVSKPQGEWVEVSCFDAFGGDESVWMVHGNPAAFHYCSECKEQARIDEFGEEILSNYCPDCGAYMKGADDGY